MSGTSSIRLCAPAEKVYKREVSGPYTRRRWASVWLTQIVYYGLPWLRWDGRPAVLFDLAARKFFLFDLVLWPQDFIYLAGLLVICAAVLFLLSAIAGRVWCSFGCPHTVYTEIFMWIEHRIEGNRSARIRLDKQPITLSWLGKKLTKHAAWIVLAFWTGITLVGYFTPMHTLLHELVTFTLGPWQTFWIFAYGGLAYMNAGWLREQFCKYLCAHARFQSVMFDRDTLVISYDRTRGEPRGVRRTWRRGAGPVLGDCIDCGLCKQVCPTGIDIRNGFQFECIDCAACIDACDSVMDKIGAARGLIRYSTENAVAQGLTTKQVRRRLIRPRVVAFVAMVMTAIAVFAGALITRPPVKLNVVLDRSTIGRSADQGMVENVYRLQVMNTDVRARHFSLAVSGIAGIQLVDAPAVDVPATDALVVLMRVRVPRDNLRETGSRFRFELRSSNGTLLSEPAVFPVVGNRY